MEAYFHERFGQNNKRRIRIDLPVLSPFAACHLKTIAFLFQQEPMKESLEPHKLHDAIPLAPFL
jgi:hypothetical protein